MTPLVRLFRIVTVGALATSIVSIGGREPAAAVPAQTATRRPGWLPLYEAAPFGGPISAAERADAIRVLRDIERILQQVPELASPKGFEVMPQFVGVSRLLGPGDVEIPNTVVEYVYRLFFFAPTQKIAGEGCSCIQVRVNFQDLSGGMLAGQGWPVDEQGRPLYTEPARGDRIPLATEVYGRVAPSQGFHVAALLTSGGELHWKTATREQYYDGLLRDFTGKEGNKLAEARAKLETTPYREWMAGAAERRQQREDALRTMAGITSPAEVAAMRKTLEDAERDATETLRASEPGDRIDNKETLAKGEAWLREMRTDLERMTPAERNMPAMIDAAGTDGPRATGASMADRDGPRILRVLTPNYDFWRVRKSPVEVRSIAVNVIASGTGLVPAVNNALVQTYRKLDWAALNKLLASPR